MSNEFLIITRQLVKRGWTDIEPKVAAGFGSGAFAGIIVNLLSSYGVPVTPELKQWLPYLVAIAGSYIVPSSGLSITSKDDGHGTTTTTNTGSVVTTATAGIPIQPPPAPEPEAPEPTSVITPVQQSAQSFLANLGKPHDESPSTDNAATAIILPQAPDRNW